MRTHPYLNLTEKNLQRKIGYVTYDIEENNPE